jgi:hypothetical protein
VAAWTSEQHLRDHFKNHAWELPGCTFADYEASSKQTLDVGTYFEYSDPDAGTWRIGCYDLATRRFTVLDEDERIVSHFHCLARYIRDLPDNNFGA